ncbi:response regulator transcription factor [Cohnella silvisoli]|uniref:Response regulator transcription factor n=1 Tax=Cohnella silvisoli TaxID=2873699 RepID=A0ABV1KXH8_9BACL|nr:response regulator transcription factor [Cohnella silvisoli]MCD9024163.1 response regulator transcription factor [Cohnella silvisoli]
MTKTIKAIVVDDHPLMAEATKQLLEQMDRIQVVGVAYDGRTCIELVEAYNPELIFLDYQLPDQSGTKLTEHIKRISPHAHIVIFTGVDVSDLVHKLLELRVSGIISKGTSEKTLKHMVACILDNHIVLPHSIFYKIKLSSPDASNPALLTDEEVRMMSMMVSGATYDQIAETIHVSKRSVDNYLRKIYDKLGVQNRIQAIRRFVQNRQDNEES